MATEMKRSAGAADRIEELLGDEARALLDHKATTIPKEQIYLPGPDFIDRVMAQFDSTGRSGHRALRRSFVCSESTVFRSEEYC